MKKLISIFVFSLVASIGAFALDAEPPLEPPETEAFNARAESCEENMAALSKLFESAQDCRWSSGQQAIDAPQPLKSLCLDSRKTLEKSQICVGEITCNSTNGIPLNFPNIACSARAGDCESVSGCVQEFLKVSRISCRSSENMSETIKTFKKGVQ